MGLRRAFLPAALAVAALVSAPAGGAAGDGNVVGRTRVEQVFAEAGVVFYPSALELGHTRLITGQMRHTSGPRVSIFIFKTAPEAQRLSAWHRTHPKVHLSHVGGAERTLLAKNLLVVWPATAPVRFTAAVTTSVQALLPHPHPRGKRRTATR